MARKISKTKGFQEHHIEFAKGTEYHPANWQMMRRWSSWGDVEKFGLSLIQRHNVKVITKRKLFGQPFARWDERPTILPRINGPVKVKNPTLLLPHNWEQRSLRSKAKVYMHEMTHEKQDAKIPFYEIMYPDPRWRWGLETNCFAVEVWLMEASRHWIDGYTDEEKLSFIERCSARMKQNYRIKGIDQQDVYRVTREVLTDHLIRARKALSMT